MPARSCSRRREERRERLVRLNECQAACWPGERTERTQRQFGAQRKPAASRYTLTHTDSHSSSRSMTRRPRNRYVWRSLVGVFCSVKKKNVLCVLSRSSQVGCDMTLCVTDICLFSLSCGFFICFSSPVLLYIYIFFFYYYFRGLVFAVSLVVWSDGLTGCGCARAYDRWWSSGMCAPRAVCCCQWERKREGVEGVSQARAAHGNIRRVDRRVDSGLIMISCFF